MALTLILLGSLVLGLILLAVGVGLLFALKNKLPGILVLAVGLVIALLSLAVFAFTLITVSVRS